MKKMMTLAACTLVASATFAQVVKDEALEESASNPQVKEELKRSPDGVCLKLAKDGTLQYIALGSASYHFGTAKDIRNKTKAAELDAKGRLVHFIEGSIIKKHGSHEEVATEQTLESSDGKKLTVQATKQELEMCREVVEEYTSGRLIGIVVLKVEKIPQEGSSTSGDIQVTIGMSSKTRAASDAAHNMITDSINARRTIGEKASKPNTPDQSGMKDGSNGASNQNKPEVRTNNTLF